MEFFEMTAPMTTSEAREQAFILMFEKSFNGDMEPEEILAFAVESEVITEHKYTSELFFETCRNVEVIDEFISKYSRGWSIPRLSKVALAVLRIAICEIRFFEKVPTGVAINEAVNICKKYASAEDCSFVNGVLGSFAKDEA